MLMLDLDAPIVPGQSAAGYQIGMSIEEGQEEESSLFQRTQILDYGGQPTGGTRYRSEHVDLWVGNKGLIDQIGVYHGYRGKLLDKIHLGMTIDDVECLIGPCAEDLEDNLTVLGILGFCFDVQWRPKEFLSEDLDFTLPALRFSPITCFFVFRVKRT